MVEAAEGPARGIKLSETPYGQWQRSQGVPVHEGSYLRDLFTADVAPWPMLGQKMAFVSLADQQQDDAWVIEIAPGGSTKPFHHLFEATFFVLAGRGATTFWSGNGQRQSVEWQDGSIFSPPMNARYEIFNGSGTDPVRLLAVTNLPMALNMYRNADFLFSSDFEFSDRYAGEEDFFSNPGEKVGSSRWRVNFVPNMKLFGLDQNISRGAGGQLTSFEIANNSMAVHCSSFPPGTYKKGHRHGVGAHVIILEGQGYSLLWKEGEEREKVDWQVGSMLSPREQEYHQHFNTGASPARYLAVRLGALDSRRWGGAVPTNQFEYEEEDPAIYDLYVAECARNGAEVQLPQPQYIAR